jgi:inhibitor of cysteine peptidase
MKPTLYLLLASVTFLAACAAPVPTPAPVDPAGSSMPALTDPSQPILVNTGETFFIVVESNPSTGYHWEVVGGMNENIALFDSREYTASEPVMPGSGGVEVWIFKAVSAGETKITLGSYPPGAEGGEPERSVTFTIEVK